MIHFADENLPLDALDEPAVPLRDDIDPDTLGDLADDMAVNGLLQPIGARGPSPANRYETVWGHRRMLAARMLQWVTIPARVCAWSTPPHTARAAENFQRTDLNPREEAKEVARLRAEGQAVSAIARILRRSIGWVETRVELLTWPPELQDQVAHGELTIGAARLLAEIDNDRYRGHLIDEAKRTGATTNVVSVWLAHYIADRERIIRNQDTVVEILERREAFKILFTCEVCDHEKDTRESVLLRICHNCARTLADERRAARTQPTP